jgi:hypothetical protein
LRKPRAWLLFWLVLLFPAVYYVVFPAPRYRHPIEPEMTILCVFLLTEIGKRTGPSEPDLPRIRHAESVHGPLQHATKHASQDQ